MTDEVRKAAEFVVKEFRAIEATGAHTRDRKFAIDVLSNALDDKPDPRAHAWICLQCQSTRQGFHHTDCPEFARSLNAID